MRGGDAAPVPAGKAPEQETEDFEAPWIGVLRGAGSPSCVRLATPPRSLTRWGEARFRFHASFLPDGSGGWFPDGWALGGSEEGPRLNDGEVQDFLDHLAGVATAWAADPDTAARRAAAEEMRRAAAAMAAAETPEEAAAAAEEMRRVAAAAPIMLG